MRAVGTKHSFSEIADTEGTILNLQHLRKIVVDKEAMTVTFGASGKRQNEHNQRDMNSTTLLMFTGRLTSDLSGRLSTVNRRRSLSELIQSHGSPV